MLGLSLDVGRMSLWEMQGKFSCKVISASNLHIRKEVNVSLCK